jgi:PTH1 family peptidyl-tRNA hydrolase
MAVDGWCEQFVPRPTWADKWNAHAATLRLLGGVRCVALKPQTFMNKSGQSVGAAARYFRVPPAKILVVHDEIDFLPGRLALKRGGGHGGHNGLRDIITQVGSRDFLRLRLGVGRPLGKSEVSAYVLSDFSAAERVQALPELLDQASLAVTCVIREGIAAAMNQFNTASSAENSST